ncbi:hypothetical protein [Streptomyces arenae]|uniref:hypothetical protein n=1 Tax=Streptomyces arenae TaxID=29301 RepID=UPI003D2AE950
MRDEIVMGLLVAGTQLKQDALDQDFGVSPGRIREALRDAEKRRPCEVNPQPWPEAARARQEEPT